MPEKLVLSWSGGKDSAMALYALLRDDRYEVVGLLTSVAAEYKRISHHGVREELLEMQAESIGLPLDRLYLPSDSGLPCTNERFEELMRDTLQRYCDKGVMLVAHGDIFLEDLRAYREKNLARLGMRGVFPLWKRDTAELIQTFIRSGFKAYLCCVEGKLGGNQEDARGGHAAPDLLGSALEVVAFHGTQDRVDPVVDEINAVFVDLLHFLLPFGGQPADGPAF